MALTWDPKDPDEVLDYKLDWSARMVEDDTITTSIWLPVDGLTVDSDDIGEDGASTTIWLSGGTLDASYDLTNRVTTSGGRTMDQTVKLKIKAK